MGRRHEGLGEGDEVEAARRLLPGLLKAVLNYGARTYQFNEHLGEDVAVGVGLVTRWFYDLDGERPFGSRNRPNEVARRELRDVRSSSVQAGSSSRHKRSFTMRHVVPRSTPPCVGLSQQAVQLFVPRLRTSTKRPDHRSAQAAVSHGSRGDGGFHAPPWTSGEVLGVPADDLDDPGCARSAPLEDVRSSRKRTFGPSAGSDRTPSVRNSAVIERVGWGGA